MNDPASRPEIADEVENMDQYDTVCIGFPIWWYIEPRIIDTFLESYDFSGKKLVPFATSGGSGMANVVKNLRKAISGAFMGRRKTLKRSQYCTVGKRNLIKKGSEDYENIR